jgi:hypothetical protein
MPTPREQHQAEELNQVLGELRVALPGVQVLLAFLLTAPFQQRFEVLDAAQRGIYVASLLGATLASLLLIAPSVYHRIHGRREILDKSGMLDVFNRMAIWGAAALGLSIDAALFLVCDLIFPHAVAVAIAAAAGIVCVALWFVYPSWRRRHELRHSGVMRSA